MNPLRCSLFSLLPFFKNRPSCFSCCICAVCVVRQGHLACIRSTSPMIIESGSLSVALSPEETAGGVAGSVTSTVYATMAIKV